MSSGQEPFGCSAEWLYLRPATANAPQSSDWVSQGNRWSPAVSLYTTSTERSWILLWRMPRPHCCHFCSYKPMKPEGLRNFGSFFIPLQWWSLKTKCNGSWDHAGGCCLTAETSTTTPPPVPDAWSPACDCFPPQIHHAGLMENKLTGTCFSF